MHKSKTKQTCPCCGGVEPYWLYRVHRLWYCVPCLRSCFGMGPARIARGCMTYITSSVDCKPTRHRTLTGAIREAKARLNVADSEIAIEASNRGVYIRMPFTVDTTDASLMMAIHEAHLC